MQRPTFRTYPNGARRVLDPARYLAKTGRTLRDLCTCGHAAALGMTRTFRASPPPHSRAARSNTCTGDSTMQRPAFIPCTYAGRPAVFDTVSRVFYTCATHTRAREWARELNEGK